MGSGDGLFPAPEPEHPDAAAVRQVITGYYRERAAEAAAELVKAQALHDERAAELAGWIERGAIVRGELAGGRLDMGPVEIVGHADSAHLNALRAAIPELGGQRTPERLAAVEEAERRAQAVRRWLGWI